MPGTRPGMTSFAEVPDFVGDILRQTEERRLRSVSKDDVLRCARGHPCASRANAIAFIPGWRQKWPHSPLRASDDKAERRVQRTFIALRRNSLALLTICERAILHRSYDQFRRSSKGKG
jgi:hypothetical protein